MPEKTRVALVGAGVMGQAHAQRWLMHDDVELVGVLDVNRAAASKIPARSYATWKTLLRYAKPDVIDICTPTTAHLDVIKLAARAEKHIFVEKPLAMSLSECEEAIRVVDRAGVQAMVAQVVRYFPEFCRAKQLIEEGAIGKPATVRTSRMAAFPFGGKNWYADITKSGGVIMDMIVHDFDWLRWCLGEIERVYARGLYGRRFEGQSLDYALVILRFSCGAVGHVTGSWAHTGGFRTTYEIAGDNGHIEHDSQGTVPLTVATRAGASAGPGVAVPESPLAGHDDPYYLEQRAFINALKAGLPVPVPLSEGREAVRIAVAALESIKTGKAVSLR